MPKATAAGASDMGADRAEAVRRLNSGGNTDPSEDDIAGEVQKIVDDRDGRTTHGDRRLATGEAGDAPERAAQAEAEREAERKQRDAELVRDADGNVVGSSHPADRVDGQDDADERRARGETDADVLRQNGHQVPPAVNGPKPAAFNPDEHTVADVQAYLDGLADDEDGAAERERVLDAERKGKGRTTITGAH